MKLRGRDAAGYFRKPDPDKALLIFGADAMRVALKRQEAVAALIGPDGAGEMRLTRLAGSTVQRDPAAVGDALRARGFFPGPRVVLVDEAGDAAAPVLATALDDWRAGDATLVVTAGALAARSGLRKAFEGHARAYAVGIYDDPPTREEIEATLAAAGLRRVAPEAMTDIAALARALDPGDFRQTVERIGLYKLDDPAPLSSEEVALLAPTATPAAIDDALHAAAEAKAGEIGAVMARLRAQGVQAVQLAIAATRHFRALHAAASDPDGPGRGIAKLRPPVFGPRRDRMERQARAWGAARLEQALDLLIEADLAVRSAARAPEMAVMERALIRLAMLGGR